MAFYSCPHIYINGRICGKTAIGKKVVPFIGNAITLSLWRGVVHQLLLYLVCVLNARQKSKLLEEEKREL